MIRTLVTNDGVNDIEFENDDDRYYWIKNKGNSTIYVSAFPNVIADGDDVAELAAGDIIMIENTDNHLYILGAGKIEIHKQNFIECPFKIKAKGGDKNVQPLILFRGTDDGYTLADGFTGFSPYYTDTETATATVISKYKNTSDESRYGYRLEKGCSINNAEGNYTDSGIITSNEPIDLTNYNTICIDFYGKCDYGSSFESMGAYFKIDKPDNLPQSHSAYDWTGWDNMRMYYRKYGRYYFDVSQLTGKHYLCFGIYHGTYQTGYTNGIKIYEMALM